MKSMIIEPNVYVYDTARLVEVFAEANAGFVSEMAKHAPGTTGYSMNASFAAATQRELETAQKLVDRGIDQISLHQPLPSPNYGLTPPVMVPATRGLTEQVAVMPTISAMI